MDPSTTTVPAPDPATLRRVFGAGLLGTTIEYYDFFIYGTAAALVFPKVFFPSLGTAAGVAASFATFGVAFIARPLGGVLFGHVGDRVGRKATLIATLLLMGLSTVLIGVLPSGAAIGVAAPILLIVLRLCQGLAVGGEWSSAALFVAEYAPPRRRGLFALSPTFGTGLGLLLATLAFLVASVAMSPDAFLAWGWRIPFLASIVLVAIGLWVRLGIAETPIYRAAVAAAEAAARTRLPLRTVLREQWREVLFGAGSVVMWLSMFYMGAVYLANYGTAALGFSRNTVLVINVVAVVWNFVGSYVGAWLSDRIGRRRTMTIGNLVAIVWSFVMFPLAGAGSPVLLGLVVSASLFLVGIAAAPTTAYLPEIFRTHHRSTGIGASFNLGSIVGGAIPPVVAAPLFAAYGSISLGIMLAVLAVISTVSVLLLRETAGRSLDERDTTAAAPAQLP
ncbi:MFS transporter, partial [Pseudonocardia sulfidoxydans]